MKKNPHSRPSTAIEHETILPRTTVSESAKKVCIQGHLRSRNVYPLASDVIAGQYRVQKGSESSIQ